jgi:hypothetical protein
LQTLLKGNGVEQGPVGEQPVRGLALDESGGATQNNRYRPAGVS